MKKRRVLARRGRRSGAEANFSLRSGKSERQI
jgi:hypothetical protein